MPGAGAVHRIRFQNGIEVIQMPAHNAALDLANMRQNGVRSLLVMCHGCRHSTAVCVCFAFAVLAVRANAPTRVKANAAAFMVTCPCLCRLSNRRHGMEIPAPAIAWPLD
jgi:hypothetical protein